MYVLYVHAFFNRRAWVAFQLTPKALVIIADINVAFTIVYKSFTFFFSKGRKLAIAELLGAQIPVVPFLVLHNVDHL
jgi:hypothetical protein